jgi:hypothetical protein
LEKSERNNIQQFESQEKTRKSIEFLLPEVYKYHSNPKKLKYIYQTPKVITIINDLKFIRKFDEASYEIIVSLIEYFLKVYYNILNDRYDFKQYFPILLDLRKSLLNTCAEVMYNIPQYSNVMDGNLWGKLNINTKKLEAITYRRIKIVSKYGKKEYNVSVDYKGPQGVDPLNDNRRMY